MTSKRLFRYFFITVISFTLTSSLQNIDNFAKGFQEGMVTGFVINSTLNNKDGKNLFDYLFDQLNNSLDREDIKLEREDEIY